MCERGCRALIRLFLCLCLLLPAFPAIAAGDRLVLDARIAWSSRVAGFGGFSGLAVLDEGKSLIAISDRGTWVEADLRRDRDGSLTGASLTASGPILGVRGTALQGEEADAEDLAIAPDGSVYLSFEHFHRVRRYPSLGGPAGTVRGPREFESLQSNSGLEALTFDAEGTLYAIPERSGAWERPFPIYRLRDGVWDSTLSIPRRGKLLVTGADFGPDGRLYLVERHFQFLGGFAIRVRSFAPGPDGFGDEKTLLETRLGDSLLDNMEGISVWRDEKGQIRATLMSDDNFNALQRTILAEYILFQD